MHETGAIQFPHCCVDYRESCHTVFPGLQLFLIVFPLNLIKLELKRRIRVSQDPRVIMTDIHVEISPMQLTYDIILNSQFL
jgi:hypothetical protein